VSHVNKSLAKFNKKCIPSEVSYRDGDYINLCEFRLHEAASLKTKSGHQANI